MSTGSARFSTTAAIGSSRREARGPEIRAALSAARSSRPLSIRTSTSPIGLVRSSSAKPIPEGPDDPTRRWRCCARPSPRCRTSGSITTTSAFVVLLAPARLQGGAASGSSARRRSRMRRTGCRRSRHPCWPAATTARRRGSCGNSCRTSEQPWVRRTAERSLAQVEALDQIDQLQAVVARTGPTAGTYSWPALIGRGVLRGVPVDPSGTPYALDASTGRVSVSRVSRRCSRCQPSRGKNGECRTPCTSRSCRFSACRSEAS